METRVENLVHLEKSVPKGRWIRSDGALYLVLLAGMFALIAVSNAVVSRFLWPRLPVQIVLYAVLLSAGYCIYRYRLVAYRYMITDRMLSVDRVVGRKIRPEAHIHLADIAAILPAAELTGVHKTRACTGRAKDALAVVYTDLGRKRALLLSPTEECKGKLIAQWKIAKK